MANSAKLQLGFSPLSKTIVLAKMRDLEGGGRLRVGNDRGRDVTNEAAQLVWQLVMAEGGEIGWDMEDGSRMVLKAENWSRVITKLTTERLEQYAHDKHMCNINDEIRDMARQLLAYEQAGKETKIYQYQSCLFNDENGETDWYWDDCDKGFFEQYDPAHRRIVYAAPVLPKQPGLLSIGELLHRLEEQTGEKWVEESAQPIIPERLIQAINRLLDNDGSRGCFDALEQHRAKTELELLLAAAQQNEPQNIPENIPEQPVSELRARAISLYKPPFKFDFGYIWDAGGQMVADQNLNEDGQILRVRGWGRISYLENPEALQDEVGEVIALALSNYWNLHIAADLIQPVSEPYKLEIDMDDADHFSITHLHEIIYGKELIWPEAKLLARFMLDVKQRVSAAPAQESE